MIQIFKNKKNKGFTLMEMVVATALFLIATSISLGIFLSSLKANSSINARHEVENEIRYIMELVSKEIRLSTIYYDYYEEVYEDGVENPVPILALEDNFGNIVYFSLNADLSSPGIIQMMLEDNGSWIDLNSEDVFVDSLDFYLSPPYNPFVQDLSEEIKQPMITLNLKAHYSKGDNNGTINIQTSISSRQYKK